MRHTYGGAALFALAALAAGGATHEDAWADQHTVTYKVVAHDPVCVAIYVEAMEAVTRLTVLREHYDRSETLAGVPILIQVPEDRAPGAVQLLLERSLVHSVQRVGTFWNGSHTVEWPPEINPDADASNRPSHCYDIDSNLAWHLRNVIIQRDSGAAGASGQPHEATVHVRLNPNNLTSMRAYLEENGATIQSAAASREYKGRTLGPQVIALIPYSIIPSLVERDDFGSMDTIHPPELLGHGGASGGFGTTHTEGLSQHEHAEEWHAAGHTGVGIRVGVIDIEFDGIEDAQSNGELPRNMILHCNGPTTTLAQCQTGISNSDSAHGTEVAEIVMDMAPDARLVIGLRTQNYTVYDITEWMITQNVNVIVASPSPLVFEGPGDGTTPDIETSLDAIDLAVDNDITWVNAAGNYVDGKDWSIWDPRTNNGLIVFDTGNDTTNQFWARAGQRVDVWLQWYDADNNNTDLNLLVTGASQHTGVVDQWGGTGAVPTESVTFVPASSGQWNINLAVIGTAVPDWVQLVVDGNTGDLEYHTSEGTIANPAESGNHGMPAAGAPAAPRTAYGSGLDNATVDLAITSHNPVCTALVLDALGAARFTDIRPSYSANDMINGTNITAVAWARDTNTTVAALAGQPEVSRVAAYSPIPQNAAPERPALLVLVTDPNADISGSTRPCSDNVSYNFATHAMASIGWTGAEPGTGPLHLSDTSPADASGSSYGPRTGSESLTVDPHPGSRLEGNLYFSLEGSLVSVGIWTHDIRATWAFVQENGGLVTSVPRDYEGRPLGARSLMGSYIPPDLLGPLMLRDEISAINAGGPPILEQ